MNGSTAHGKDWGKFFAIAGAYAACYELARHVSFSHWMLTAGLRLACLLLVPRRYWPALLLGETLPVVESALLDGPRFGMAWAIAAAIPMIALWMPFVRWLRRGWPIRDDAGTLDMRVLLKAALGCAVITAVATTLELMMALYANPGTWPEISLYTYFWAYLLGAYLGALTLTPSILALQERFARQGHFTWTAVARSRLFRDVAGWAIPTCAALAWLAMGSDVAWVSQASRLGMLVPVLALAWRHGWHGSAIGGMFASVALAVTSTVLLDGAMVRTQVVLALVISATLLVGTRVARRTDQPAVILRTNR
ncbi:MASE1 domain-containing protein [Bacillus sp. NP157]|nr:MASE1 domain-containing protein [Bacillus sp. NP157]